MRLRAAAWKPSTGHGTGDRRQRLTTNSSEAESIIRLQRMAGNWAVDGLLSGLQRQVTSEIVIAVGLSKAQLAKAHAFYRANRHRYSADLIRAIQRAVGVPEDSKGEVTDETIVAIADKQDEFGPPLKRDGMAGPRTLGRLFPTGLADAATAARFAADVKGTTLDAAAWAALGTPQERADRLVTDLAATQLAAAEVGVAPTARVDTDLGVNAVFVHEDWEIHLDIDKLHLAKPSLTKSEARDIATGVYHEARHVEQYHKMARMLAAKGLLEADIIRRMGFTGNARAVAKDAVNNPLSKGSTEFLIAEDQFDAELGSGQQRHRQIEAEVVAAAKAFDIAKRRQDSEPSPRNAEAQAAAQARLDRTREAHDAEATETDAILTEREAAQLP